MKAKALKLIDGRYINCIDAEASHLELQFPIKFAPLKTRIIPVQTSGAREGTGNWSWNGSLDKPTLRPSVLTIWEGGDPTVKVVCHSFVNEGVVQFLDDCTHELAGLNVPLLEADISKDD
jgi:Family of unknown function (DUF6527)